MVVWVSFSDEGSHFLRPIVVSEEAVFVCYVPHDVGEGCESGDCVAIVSLLILSSCILFSEWVGSGSSAVDVEYHGYDNVFFAGFAQKPLILLPVGYVESGYVESGVF